VRSPIGPSAYVRRAKLSTNSDRHSAKIGCTVREDENHDHAGELRNLLAK
jgi:hypothetical protein